MSIPDTIMTEWLELLTDRPANEIAALLDPSKTHPMEAKKQLAGDIVAFYHGKEAAASARAEWERTKSQRQDPSEIPEIDLPGGALVDGKMQAYKLLVALGMAPSNNEARRLVQGGGMNVGADRTRITDANTAIEVGNGLIVRVGNRKIARIRIV